MLIIDSREKKWEHIERYLDKHNIEHSVEKLDVGDYMNKNNPHLAIDRKKDLQELAGNLCTKDNGRFWREVRRSKENQIQLIVLVEQRGYKTIQDVQNWKSKYSRVSGYNLAKEMYRLEIGYNVQFVFCDKLSTGRVICGILKAKEPEKTPFD